MWLRDLNFPKRWGSEQVVLCWFWASQLRSQLPLLPKSKAFRGINRPLTPDLVLPFLGCSILSLETPKFTKDFPSLPNPPKPWKNKGKHPNNQGNSLFRINQGNPNKEEKGIGGDTLNYFEKYRDTPPISIAMLLHKYAQGTRQGYVQAIVATPPYKVRV